MISFLCALNCEARALIDHYALKKTDAGPFGHFVSPENALEVELLVTGIGAIAMASGVGWLAAKRPVKQRVWVNIGIAGHATFELGQIVLVHGCAEAIQGRAHYPPLLAKWPANQTAACISYNAPATDYLGDALADMEAFAFFTAAIKFSNSELVQSIKVVSDNRSSGIELLNAKTIESLIATHTLRITSFAESLFGLLPKRLTDTGLLSRLEQLRATHSQRRLVRELLNKAVVLECLTDELTSQLESMADTRQVIELLTQTAARISPDISVSV